MDKLTIAMQNYLETIYEIAVNNNDEHSGVRLSDIAAKLNVSKASVNNAISVLVNAGYVKSEKYQDVFLTENGIETAKLLTNRHEVIKKLFTDVLGVDDETANEDACAIEHVISREAIQKIKDFLDKQENQ